MQELFRYSQIRVANTSMRFVRYLYDDIVWEDRLIGIVGARGTGKTTLMLQYVKRNFGNSDQALYVSLDDFYFTQHRMFDVAEEFYQNGGRHLFIDEVHKYNSWSVEIKKLHDVYVDLQIVFSGSSALQLQNAEGDLSRRAAMYHLHEMSFREYLNLVHKTELKAYELMEVLENHQEIAAELIKEMSILPHFKQYLEKGLYPFFLDAKGQYHDRLVNTINVIIEIDLVITDSINYATSVKLRKLISLIADSVPFKVNISELSRKAELSRDVLLRLLGALDRANLIKGIRQKGAPTGHLTKPDKLYLNNTALLKALNTTANISEGTIRETFFMNQLSIRHNLNSLPVGDFLVDSKLSFEIGGKSKSKKQIAGIKGAYIAADNIEYGYKETIPLWLFGFLY